MIRKIKYEVLKNFSTTKCNFIPFKNIGSHDCKMCEYHIGTHLGNKIVECKHPIKKSIKKERDILEESIDFWGIHMTSDFLQKKCDILSNFIYDSVMYPTKNTVEEFLEKMIDVEIILNQMKLVYKEDLWQQIKKDKLMELSKSIKKKKDAAKNKV
jgi:hypothetical protein